MKEHIMIKIDSERFRTLREQMGTLPAREQCVREAVLHAIAQAESMEDVKCVLMEIVKQIRFTQ
jgi:hypothetical protein